MRTTGALAIAAVLAGTAVAGCGSSGPSAQCRSQVAQIAALQADARAISASPAAVSGALLDQFNADVRLSGVILARVKAEGCPASGYKGGYTLG